MSTKSKKSLSMSEIVNKVCEELPEDWELEVSMVRGSGYVRIYDPNAKLEDYYPNPGDEISIEECVLNALRYAKGKSCFEKPSRIR